jgi:hypothetical protein
MYLANDLQRMPRCQSYNIRHRRRGDIETPPGCHAFWAHSGYRERCHPIRPAEKIRNALMISAQVSGQAITDGCETAFRNQQPVLGPNLLNTASRRLTPEEQWKPEHY